VAKVFATNALKEDDLFDAIRTEVSSMHGTLAEDDARMYI
jgi:hypothetical protein